MMREILFRGKRIDNGEILFRGKRIDNGEWVEGSLVVWPDDDTDICYSENESFFEMTKTIVNPASVGQYTGLTDKNGKKIFEGDVVRYEEDGEQGGIFEVAWAKGNCEIALSNDQEGFGIVYAHPYLEVIGNIHDNPELIGGGEDG